MATHSNTLTWKIPWTEEPGRLKSMGSQRVGHDWATSFHFSFSYTGEGNDNPLQCSCLDNPRDRGAWWASVNGVAQSWIRLKQLSSLSHIPFLMVLVFNLSHSVESYLKNKNFYCLGKKHHKTDCDWKQSICFSPWECTISLFKY